MITELAPAKINLALHVRARRPDGYHEIETLFAFCRDGDVVTVNKAPEGSFMLTGPHAKALAGQSDNLVARAVAAFKATYSIRGSQQVTLDKHLPIASGIGGGSADAAATLRALAKMYGKPLDSHVLQMCAASIGSDVPACLLGRTAFGTGRGERLTPIDGLTGMPVLLVNPGVAVSTAEVFKAWDGVDRGQLGTGDPLSVAFAGRNDLQPAAITIAPTIADVLSLLVAQSRVTLVRMSGSGATCFALFEDELARSAARRAIAAAQPDWWYLESTLA
ncbi:MAG: 4-(cytidine 5'-diphospho)-2-C-methyl-D-erythritol kinase [Sphingomonas sp.]